jgi:ribosomal protein S18 acetylase RimI-like enzyme
MGIMDAADRHSPLTSQLEAKTRDLDWTLAHFTFVANATTLAAECDIACSPAMSVASCRTLPELGFAFVGDSSDLLATYAAFLADPGSEVSLLVNEDQRRIVEQAFRVVSVDPKVQMIYRENGGFSESLQVAELADNDLSAAQALAKAEKVPFLGFSANPLQQGSAFGIWDRRRLVAMGTTVVCLPGVAQIGNIITRREYRRQGYGTAVVSALVRAHSAAGRGVFVIVDQQNVGGLGLLVRLGFEPARPMYAMSCVLGPAAPDE